LNGKRHGKLARPATVDSEIRDPEFGTRKSVIPGLVSQYAEYGSRVADHEQTRSR
jgi:hypothetical protein